MASKIIPQRHKDLMVETYLSGKSARESAVSCGYSWSTCIRELKRRNIKPRIQTIGNRKYNVNEAFFNKIDNEEKAYWLGFITADGSVTDRSLIIKLCSKDRNHLVKFLKSIKSQHVIYDIIIRMVNDKQQTQCGVGVNSIKLVADLNNLGVMQNKSLVVKPCSQVPNNLIRHYWRGIIDGDGYISYGRRNKSWKIGLTGNRYIVESFCSWIQCFTKTKAKPRHYPNYCLIQYGGNKITKNIAKTLYENSNIFLDRKRKLAEEIMEGRHVG